MPWPHIVFVQFYFSLVEYWHVVKFSFFIYDQKLMSTYLLLINNLRLLSRPSKLKKQLNQHLGLKKKL